MQLDHLLDNIEAGADLLGILSHPARFRILHLVADREVSVNDIVEVVGLSQSSVSLHLAKLRERSLVGTRRDARTIFYTCNHQAVLFLMSEIIRLFPSGRPAFSPGKKRQKKPRSRT
jgi:DNA-binding transcriptional ArsR family regulator